MSASLRIEVHNSITVIPAESWDPCAGSANPFLSHGFFRALEESGSAVPNTGWLPQHLTVREGDGPILACAPLYLKGHSYGEYVFDWGWASAYERAGGRYYPKLQSAVPFSPVTGERFLIGPDGDTRQLRLALLNGMLQLVEQRGASSLHITFPTEAEWEALSETGLLMRTGIQYHWGNEGYENFEDFLAALNARKRKAIRKERRAVAEQNLTLRWLHGAEITPAIWDRFYDLYLSTVDKKYAHAYLNRAFFDLLGENLGERVALATAWEGAELVAAALNLVGQDTLYGRNWGSFGDYPFLHFELCYYQAIDYAIAHGLQWVEAGAQGEHKIQRGYLPRRTYSAHMIADPGLRDAVARYLRGERLGIEQEIEELRQFSPFRQT